MKNQKEILLNPEEILQLLEGGLYWKDIETKVEERAVKRKLDLGEEEKGKAMESFPETAANEAAALVGPESQDDLASDIQYHNKAFEKLEEKDPEEVEQEAVRDILLGERQEILKDRQIDLTQIQELAKPLREQATSTDLEDTYPEERDPIIAERSRSTEETTGNNASPGIDTEINKEEKDRFTEYIKSMYADDETGDIFDEEIEDFREPFWRGWRLLLLMLSWPP